MDNTSIAEYVSGFDFGLTLVRLERAIAKAGMTIFAHIDHADAARRAGLQMPSTTVLLYGSPRGGTPIMLATPQAALDLPLRVLVREHPNGRTIVAFHPAAPMLRMAGVPEALTTKLDPAQSLLIEAIQPDLKPL